MGTLQLPMDEIEHWRNKALLFSRSDQLGHLLVSSFDLMRSVLVSGLHSHTLPLKIKVLSMECATALAAEPNHNDESRSLNYGYTSSICALLNCLSEAANNVVAANDQPPSERRPHELQVNNAHVARAIQFGAVVNTAFVPKVEPNERLDASRKDVPAAAAQPAQPVPVLTTQSPTNNEAVVAVAKEKEEEDVIIIKDEIMDVPEEVAIDQSSMEPANYESGFVEPIGEEDSGMDEAGRLMEAFGETLDGTTDDAAEDVMEDSANVNPTVITSPGPNKSRHSRLSTLKKRKGEDAKRRASAPSKFSPGPEEVASKKHKKRSSVTNEEKEKSHQCSACDSSFISASKLKRHMITHTGEKPFSCDQCGQRFTEKFSMAKHLRRSHSIKPNKCSDCEESFSMYGDLVEHRKTAHK
ncbi:hypothetical protein PRIPAC_80206 [Pristionchus pacificus]|uniref:Zinc finger protein n=1 Tax=Pristionchus pacificus TaxID=54126 RepID=A0A454XUN3_PRIPA|nr:hypothetical protein PRIPAC_80206 [Pristionchus pacificus]|eukprot:PDM65397.1 zinc finger protein [Pristionchus pacificus]